jgi:hypothetical protein
MFMTTLGPYIGVGIQTGSKEDIYLNFFGWHNFGQGEFAIVEDYRLFFKGKAVVFKKVWAVSVDLTLIDKNASSTNGPSRIEIGGWPR